MIHKRLRFTNVIDLIKAHEDTEPSNASYKNLKQYDPALVSKIHPDHVDLLYTICLESTPAIASKLGISEINSEWIGAFIYDFSYKHLSQCISSEVRDAEFKDNGLNFSTFRRIKSQGCGALTTLQCICTIAKLCNIPLSDFIEKFVTYCFKDLGLSPDKAFLRDNSQSYENSSSSFTGSGRNIIKKLNNSNQSYLGETPQAQPFDFHPTDHYQIELKYPVNYTNTAVYFGAKSLDIYGREDEKKVLRSFLEDEDNNLVAWYQLAGVAGQGKSRMALYLMEVSIELGWSAGFLDDESLIELCENWNRWNPTTPHLLIFDYIVGREREIGKLFSLLKNEKNLRKPVRLLLVERQRWDKGGFLRPKYFHNQPLNSKESNIINQVEFLDNDEVSEWFKLLHSSESTRFKHELSLFLNQTMYETGVMELSDIGDEDLYRIISESCKIINPLKLDIDQETSVAQLRKLDPEGRPLYAYLYGQILSQNNNYKLSTLDDFLSKALLRQYERRWHFAFPDKIGIWASDNPALRLAILATIIKGVDYKDLFEKRLISECSTDERRHAMMLTGSPIRINSTPGNIILPLMPDILGEWFVLENLSEALPIKDLFLQSWKCNPKETALFIHRITQDFPTHIVTNKALSVDPESKAVYKAMSEVAIGIFLNLWTSNKNLRMDRFLIKSLEYGAKEKLDCALILGLAHLNGIGVEKNKPIASSWIYKCCELGLPLNVCFVLSNVNSHQTLGLLEIDASTKAIINRLADLKIPAALKIMAELFVLEVETDERNIRIIDTLSEASKYGDEAAMLRLAEAYKDMRYGQKYNPAKFVYWCEKSAERGNVVAMIELASFYAGANHTKERNYEKEYYWTEKAANSGNIFSIKKIKRESMNRYFFGISQPPNKPLKLKKSNFAAPRISTTDFFVFDWALLTDSKKEKLLIQFQGALSALMPELPTASLICNAAWLYPLSFLPNNKLLKVNLEDIKLSKKFTAYCLVGENGSMLINGDHMNLMPLTNSYKPFMSRSEAIDAFNFSNFFYPLGSESIILSDHSINLIKKLKLDDELIRDSKNLTKKITITSKSSSVSPPRDHILQGFQAILYEKGEATLSTFTKDSYLQIYNKSGALKKYKLAVELSIETVDYSWIREYGYSDPGYIKLD